LEKETLLGIHAFGLAIRDGKEARVEVGGIVEEAALARDAVATPSGLRIVQILRPATISGHGPDKIALFF